MFSFKFKGESSRDYGITVLRRPPRQSANSRLDVTEIDGLDGALADYLGENTYTVSMEIAIEGKHKIEEIKRWLTGSGKFERSDVPGRYLRVERQSGIEFRYLKDNLYLAKLTFQAVDPFWYSTDESWERVGGDIYAQTSNPELIPSTLHIPKHDNVPYERYERELVVVNKRTNQVISLEDKPPVIVTTYSKERLITIMYVPYKDLKVRDEDKLVMESRGVHDTHYWGEFKVVKIYKDKKVIEARTNPIWDKEDLEALKGKENKFFDKFPRYYTMQGAVIDREDLIGRKLKVSTKIGTENKGLKLRVFDGPEIIHEEKKDGQGTIDLDKSIVMGYNTLLIGAVLPDNFPGKRTEVRGYPGVAGSTTWIMESLEVREDLGTIDSYKIINKGNAPSPPEIKIIGESSEKVDVLINDVRFILRPSQNEYEITIDCRDKTGIYSRRDGGELIIGYDYPVLYPGENTIEIKSAPKNTIILIRRKDRWRG